MAVAVVDIGKTNAKLVLVDGESGAVIDGRSTSNAPVGGGLYPHADVDGLWRWIVDGLGAFAARAPITDIVPVAHGATVALLDAHGLALPVLDYEHPGPDVVSPEYDLIRPPFEQTYSPALPGGLNAGRQLYWLEASFPEAFARAEAIVPYPQYWAWRLSGVAASEVSSLGAHTDLWNVVDGCLSQICTQRGWASRMAPLRSAWDVLGGPSAALRVATGLDASCRIRCGVHDSNASLLPHLGSEKRPGTIVSTGTWAIVMAPGGRLDVLDECRDCLANVDVRGDPVPSARFMGGREFELLTESCADVRSDPALLPALYAREPAILPTLTPGIGPFGATARGWSGPWPDTTVERRTAAGLYIAALAATCCALTGGAGSIVVEGPFAGNRTFVQALADLTGERVECPTHCGGTLAGALLLARDLGRGPRDESATTSVQPSRHRGAAQGYLARWSEAARVRSSGTR